VDILGSRHIISSNYISGVVEVLTKRNEIGCVGNAISWCNDKNRDLLKNYVSTSLIIISNNIEIELNQLKNYIVVENPRITFQETLINFF
jgi:hypothetical protein